MDKPVPIERAPIKRDPKRDAWFDERFDEMKGGLIKAVNVKDFMTAEEISDVESNNPKLDVTAAFQAACNYAHKLNEDNDNECERS